MQGVQIPRNKAYKQYAAMTKDGSHAKGVRVGVKTDRVFPQRVTSFGEKAGQRHMGTLWGTRGHPLENPMAARSSPPF